MPSLPSLRSLVPQTKAILAAHRHGTYRFLTTSWIPTGYFWVSPKPLPALLLLPAIDTSTEEVDRYCTLGDRTRNNPHYNRLRLAEIAVLLLFIVLTTLTCIGDFSGSLLFSFAMLSLLAVITDVATTPYFVTKAKNDDQPSEN